MTVFLTFGDARFEGALRRIEREAAASGFFDELRIRRPRDLGRAFWRKHGRFVSANRRGYGYWIWKPWLVLDALVACQPDEILVYADAGCTINGNGRKRFDDYRRLAEGTPSGVMGFQLELEERRYTKGDAFEALHAWHLKNTPQVVTTAILWRRCESSIEFARDWLTLAESYNLLSDVPSVVRNDPAFVEHRHDQSLFSLLAKLRGGAIVDDETALGDGSDAVPFLASRLKGRPRGPLRTIRRNLGVLGQRLRYLF